MSRYLPFGREIIPTPNQIRAQQNKFKQYEYYGIPYGLFDATKDGEGNRTQRDKDIEQARILINNNKQIPSDLKQRLLKYKEENMNK